jgi:hypothetical protein
LRDPSLIAAQCRLWVDRATRKQGGSQAPNDLEDRLVRAALTEAMTDMNRWIDHLAQLVSSDPGDAGSRRGLLAMAVRTVIDHYPQALLQYESLPAALVEQLRRAARPVVPPTSQPTHMEGPPLGELPPAFQPQLWRRVFGRAATILLALLGYKLSR